jgi:hypothetical protein
MLHLARHVAEFELIQGVIGLSIDHCLC